MLERDDTVVGRRGREATCKSTCKRGEAFVSFDGEWSVREAQCYSGDSAELSHDPKAFSLRPS